MLWYRTSFLPLVVCVSLFLTGCSSSGEDGSSSGEPAVHSTPARLQTAGLQFPLDAYEATSEQREVLGRARVTLVAQCMKRFGLKYSAPGFSGSPGSSPLNGRIFGVVDMKIAAQYGYQNPVALKSPVKPKQKELSPVEDLALNGEKDARPADVMISQEEAGRKGEGKRKINNLAVPIGGCSAEATRRLYYPTKASLDVLYIFNLKGEAESRARADSRVREVNERWSKCMSESGFRVSVPSSVVSELGLQDALQGQSAIAAAKADVDCKSKVNLVGIYYAIHCAYQNQLIDAQAESLTLAKAQLEDRLRLAASLGV